MKKILMALMILALLVGCSKQEVATSGEQIEAKEEAFNPDEVEEIIVSDDKEEEKPQEEVDLENKVKSPLTGLYIDKEKLNDRPIAVMLDNQYKARPQAGLSEADVVYEVAAESNITRYIAIIYANKPEIIGPVRSSRPYFLDKALEYDPIYVHFGGSEQAKKDIKSLKMANISGITAWKNTFWRVKHKKMPHNAYTSYNAIMKEANGRKYNKNGSFETLQFNDKDTEIEGTEHKEIQFPYRGKSYTSGFKYNNEDGLYYRYVNNKPHLDEISKIHLTAKNILVQYSSQKVIDSVGRLELGLVGEGKGMYLTNGKAMDVTWKKPSRRALTRFYDSDGSEIRLNPGITWYQIIPDNLKAVLK